MQTARYLAVFVSVSIGIASADEFKPPPMKEGLWETVVVQTTGGKKQPGTPPVKMCESKNFTESQTSDAKELRKNDECSSTVTKLSPDSYAEETQCKKGANAGAVIKTLYSHQGDIASHTEMRFGHGQSETVVTMDSKWLGSCPAGMKPGDLMMDGKIIPGGN
jgi:Protein of unknown function (DUF3617)